MSKQNDTSAHDSVDDVVVNDKGIDKALDDALGNLFPDVSADVVEDSPEELEDQDLVEEDAGDDVDLTNEEDEDGVVEDEDDESVDEDSAQDDDTIELGEGEEVDMDFVIPFTHKGEEVTKTIDELIRGFQSEKDQSKKGRELAEERKEFEEQVKKQTESEGFIAGLNNQLLGQSKEKEVKSIQGYKSLIEKVKSGDTPENYDGTTEVGEMESNLRAMVERHQGNEAKRQQWAGQQNTIMQKQAEEQQAERVTTFYEEIPTLIEGEFDDERYSSNMQFAIENGLPEEMVLAITSAPVMAFIDSYRKQSEGIKKGSKVRKKVKVKKAPIKKSASKTTKAKQQLDDVKERARSGKGSESDNVALADSYWDNIKF